MDKKCEKDLPGVIGQTLFDSITEQIFELQVENQHLKDKIKTICQKKG